MKLPVTLEGVCIIVSRGGNPGNGSTPTISIVPKGDTSVFKQTMQNAAVTEAEVYEIVDVKLVGAKVVSVVSQGVLQVKP